MDCPCMLYFFNCRTYHLTGFFFFCLPALFITCPQHHSQSLAYLGAQQVNWMLYLGMMWVRRNLPTAHAFWHLRHTSLADLQVQVLLDTQVCRREYFPLAAFSVRWGGVCGRGISKFSYPCLNKWRSNFLVWVYNTVASETWLQYWIDYFPPMSMGNANKNPLKG